MRREALLLPLSREHHRALVFARRAERLSAQMDAAAASALQAEVLAELEPHFAAEETWLLPMLRSAGEDALVAQTLEEHRALRRLMGGLARAEPTLLASFAELLRAHVRFEERTLFEKVQALPAAALASR